MATTRKAVSVTARIANPGATRHQGNGIGSEVEASRRTAAMIFLTNADDGTAGILLGKESLDVTLAYLKGKDAESEEAQEYANSSSLALYA